ncbi:Pvc16 family protein [Agathobaculum sp. NTUH-O15-33]|uniref:Pvc16 family protein n=1 Tax=Agathobaculum sp. NTUH-O15-33 TaxID=3079302 RepID=UPI002958D1ED|nr:Pvc16 family protein [Agathobaculum sp. NTUH-O15-33]WNX85666.1 Pvc16 family protein [Agathobaculum sp. NTUH-O15-33]
MKDEFARVSGALLSLLRDGLSPWPLAAREDIALASPAGIGGDCRMGVFLYDLQDHTEVSPAQLRYTEAGRRVPPPVPFALSYMLFCSEGQAFGGRDPAEAHALLSAAVAAVNGNRSLCLAEQEEPVALSFARLPLATKVQLWSSFQKPMQPAVFLVAAPVYADLRQPEPLPPVRQVRVHGKRREEAGR